MSPRPLVTIGVPVYNDEPWLPRSIERLLSQDYDNLEIIIADDGSSDRSPEICREFANRDSRIRFIQNKFNLGAVRNHNILFELSQGDFFAWGSGHDFFYPSFVSKCIRILQQDENLILCYPQADYLDLHEKLMKETFLKLELRQIEPAERFKALMQSAANANMFYGLFRSSALAKAVLPKKMMGGDILFLAEIALSGGIAQVDEVLVCRKMNRPDERAEQCTERWINNVIQPRGLGLEGITPWLDMVAEYIRIVDAAAVSATDKESMLREVICFAKRNFGASIENDLAQLVGVGQAVADAYGDQINLLKFYSAEILHRLDLAKIFAPESDRQRNVRVFCDAVLEQRQEETKPGFERVKVKGENSSEAGIGSGWQISSVPFKTVYFEVCGVCNARCPYCITASKGSNAARGMATVELFTKSMTKLMNAGWIDLNSVIHLFTWGEPTLHPQLPKIMTAASDLGLRYGMSTNAYVLPEIDADAIRGLFQLTISMPGFSQASYDRVHGFRFNQIIENIRCIVEAIRKRNSHVDIQLNFHIYRFNTHEVADGEEFARQLGIRFNPYYAYINNLRQLCGWVIGSLSDEEMGRINADLFSEVMREGLEAGARDIPADYRCPQIDYLILDEFANVATCCVLPRDHADYSCGNLLNDDLATIMSRKVSRPTCSGCVSSGLSRFAHAPKDYRPGRF